ncbi:hypothetical protein SNE40_018606 [Patella caerulea]|uniref:DUF7064 domain-containing protein n=1 Tax=Patella caerulea TaxID=87958 RepID=A0AAN8J5C4_PATCE
MWFFIINGLLFLAGIYFFLTADPPPVKGVYRQKGKWFPLKFFIFKILFWLRQRKSNKLKKNSGEDAGYGMKSRISPEEMDKVQTLSPNHPQAVDAVYFNGGNKDGVYMVAATARRHKNLTQTILILLIPEIGLLEMPTQPDTNLSGEEGIYSAGGLVIKPVEVMKKWKISFNGKLKLSEKGKTLFVSFDLEWTAISKYFDFDTDLDPSVMADAIAREDWTREYFQTLQKAHQTHYEQFGEITGSINIDGYNTIDIKVQGVRDHSYGNIREWKNLHRYGIQYMYFEDGSCACVGCICMPITMSRLTIGYIFHPDGTMKPVSNTDFEFYNFGDDGHPPKEMSLNFEAGGKQYHLQINVLHCPIFYMGEDWDVKIYERFCRYKLNGINGWGISEWEYRNIAGRSDKIDKHV